MPVGVIAAALFAAAGSMALWRAYRDSTWLVVALMAVATTGVVIIRDGLRTDVASGPLSGSLVLTGVLMGLLFWATALGLPRPLALVTGIGLTSRPLRFSDRVRTEWMELASTLNDALADRDRRVLTIPKAQRAIHRLRALRAPDAEWGRIRDELAAAFETGVDLLGSDATPDAASGHARTLHTISARWQSMVDTAAAEQRRLATPSRRRRRRAVWLATPGLCMVLTAGAAASSAGVLSRGLTNAGAWIDIVELIAGLGLLGAAVISLLPVGRSRGGP